MTDLAKSIPSPSIPLDLSVIIGQAVSHVSLKDFEKKGLRKVKVISEKDLLGLITQKLEKEVNKRLESICRERDEAERALQGLEEEVIKLRRELEALRPLALKGEYIKEAVVALREARDSIEGMDIPEEFYSKFEASFLRLLSEKREAIGPQEKKGLDLSQFRPAVETAQGGRKGALFESLLRENVRLRGHQNQGGNPPEADKR